MSFLETQLEDPIRFARLRRWFYLGLVAVVLAEFILPFMLLLRTVFSALNLPAVSEMFDVHGPHFWFEWIPAWGSLYGLASCVAIILVSKFIGKKWLMRPEDYYDS